MELEIMNRGAATGLFRGAFAQLSLVICFSVPIGDVLVEIVDELRPFARQFCHRQVVRAT